MDATDFSVTPKPTPAFIRSMRIYGWGDFKAKLVRCGVMKDVADGVPEAWQEAFCKCYGRTYPMK